MGLLDDLGGKTLEIQVPIPTRDEFITAAQGVLWVLAMDTEVGVQPGAFTADLINFMSMADKDNLSKLSLGFPALATAVDMYKNKPGGAEIMRHLVKTSITRPGDGSQEEGN